MKQPFKIKTLTYNGGNINIRKLKVVNSPISLSTISVDKPRIKRAVTQNPVFK
jgi:hypothetical protein